MEDTNTPWTSIDLYLKGFHVKKSFPGDYSIEKIVEFVDKAIEAKFEPSWNGQTSKEHLQPSTITNVPVCQVHGVPMIERAGQYGKFWSCPSKLLDGSYCKWRPAKQ